MQLRQVVVALIVIFIGPAVSCSADPSREVSGAPAEVAPDDTSQSQRHDAPPRTEEVTTTASSQPESEDLVPSSVATCGDGYELDERDPMLCVRFQSADLPPPSCPGGSLGRHGGCWIVVRDVVYNGCAEGYLLEGVQCEPIDGNVADGIPGSCSANQRGWLHCQRGLEVCADDQDRFLMTCIGRAQFGPYECAGAVIILDDGSCLVVVDKSISKPDGYRYCAPGFASDTQGRCVALTGVALSPQQQHRCPASSWYSGPELDQCRMLVRDAARTPFCADQRATLVDDRCKFTTPVLSEGG